MRVLSLIILVLACLNVSAQRDSLKVTRISVCDAFTRETLKDARLTVMDTDSTVLLEPECLYLNFLDRYAFVCRMPSREHYIFKAECKGYETSYVDISFKKNESSKNSDDILLSRAPVLLDEVTVTGSKVLMVNKGDTIVFNASAFELSGGSMLDGLIKRLPGVELHPGGRIMVNGKFVSSLLVNGRDFFSGDPKIALENLPAYYVDKVKVYHKTSLRRQVMYGDTVKADPSVDPYVMDVLLKRDYATGWLGNASVGYGTDERYMARLFAMRYTHHSGLFAYGNMNNLTNGQTVSGSGSWASRSYDEGLPKARTFGISFDGDDKVTKMKYGTSASMSIVDADYENDISSDSYYATGNIFQRSRSRRSNKRSTLSWSGSWSYPKTGKFMLSVKPTVSYTKTDNSSLSQSASFVSDPQDAYRGASIDSLYAPPGSLRLTDILINRREQQTLGSSNSLSGNVSSSSNFRLLGHFLTVTASASFSDAHRRDYALDHLGYGSRSLAPDERQNRYSRQPSKDYHYSAKLEYPLIELTRTQRNYRLALGYQYSQRYSSGERQLYRLDRLEDYNGSLGMLPSATDLLQTAIDLHNSYNTTSFTRENGVSVQFKWRKLTFNIPATLTYDRTSDRRDGRQQRLTKTRPAIRPSMSYYNPKNNLHLNYRLSSILPSMYYLLDVRDDADPMQITLGNPDLKYTWTHLLTVDYQKTKTERQQTLSASLTADLMQNAVSIWRSYDLTTGITTSRPENINGNWAMQGRFSYGQQVDRTRHLALTSTTTAAFQHSVDYASLGMQDSRRNTVDNINVGETLKADWRLRDWYVAATAHADWRHATSPAEYFTDVNAWDYNYGLTLTKQLVKNLDLDTEMMMWSRRGYTDATMNDDNLIWNISLSYAFGRLAQWIVKAEGRDILRQQSSVRHTMNAQGRTETWFRTIPSYWMLSLQYQFKKEPKKR